jgi:hypothetical protein
MDCAPGDVIARARIIELWTTRINEYEHEVSD